MSRNLVIQLAILLGVLLVAAYVAGVFDSDVSTVDVPEFDVSPSDVEELSLERGGERLWALSRASGSWRLVDPFDYAADSSAVARLLTSLEDLAFSSVVSTNADRHARYGVDSTGLVLAIRGHNTERMLTVGGESPDFQSQYVRVDGGGDVLLTRRRLTVEESADRWRDPAMLRIVPAAVQRAVVQTAQHAYSVERADSGWIVRSGGDESRADSALVTRWLDRFSRLNAGGFLSGIPPDSVRENASGTLALEMAGVTRRLYTMSADGDEVAVATDEAPVTFRWQSYQLDTFLPAPSALQSSAN